MLKQTRLDSLSDGIFAIVMTLLVLEIRVPELSETLTNTTLAEALVHLMPFFMSYILSFLLLFIYWRGHHYIASVLARNIDDMLTTINALFFLFVALVPFSTLLLSLYNETQMAIAFYGANVIIIGLLLYWMRQYIVRSPSINNTDITSKELQHGTLRILVPVYTAVLAIVVSFIHIETSLILFTLGIIFNLSRQSTRFITKLFPNALKP